MKRPFLKSLIFFFFFILCLSANAQIEYQNSSSLLGDEQFSIFPMGFTDVNGDHRDDILQLHEARDLNIYLQTGEPTRMSKFNRPNLYPDQIWTLASGDLNNDGYDELMVSGIHNNTRIYNFNEENGVTLDQIKTEGIYAQGSNMVDINNDGFLDVFICHDEASNLVYINDQNSGLNLDASGFDFNTVPASDNSGNYASEWVDYDDDGDLDVYIVKCRQGILDETDPRRINVMHRNNGDGTFTEMAASVNLDIEWQSWVGQWGDIDNDGDLDCYMVNHDHADQLLINNNGTFVIEEMFTGDLLFGSSIQTLLRDFDNDTDLDILITGPKDYLLWNDGAGNFTINEEPFGPVDAYSATVGDINDDGFLDIFTAYGVGLIETGLTEDRLFLSMPNGNNFIKFSLKGETSNLEGVGAKLMLYGPWGQQRRDIRSGESYGIVNSTNANFGLANFNQVDSLVVFWPSGQKDVILNPEINRNHLVTEGVCSQAFAEIEADGDLFFCPGDSVTLSINTTADVTWSDGQTSNSIIVKTPGSFMATLDFGGGCTTVSNIVFVDGDPEVELPNIEVSGANFYCPGSPPILSVQEYDFISWSTGENTNIVFPDEEGWISVEVQDLECGSVWKDSVYIEELIVDEPFFTMGDSIDVAGEAMLIAQGDSIHWFGSLTDNDPVYIGEEFNVEIAASTNFYAANIQEFDIDPIIGGEQEHRGTTFYSSNSLSAAMIFDALLPFKLNAVSVFTDMAGEREIELRDEDGIVLQSKIVNIPANVMTRVELGFDVSQGENYYLATNSNTNFQNFGFTSPRLIRTFDVPLDYPMLVEDILQINQSSFGTDYFYYFYSWEIDQGSTFCESERVKVQGIVGGLSNIDELSDEGISLYPNPADDLLKIDVQSNVVIKNFEIFNLQGQLMRSGSINNNEISLHGLAPSSYLISLMDSNAKKYNFRIFKTN